jgi:hypothetical protein
VSDQLALPRITAAAAVAFQQGVRLSHRHGDHIMAATNLPHALVHQVFSVEDWERCKFTSQAFADAAVSSLDLIAAANPAGDDPEPSFDWVRASNGKIPAAAIIPKHCDDLLMPCAVCSQAATPVQAAVHQYHMPIHDRLQASCTAQSAMPALVL